MRLYDTEFKHIIKMDKNRADDGLALRYRFIYDYTFPHTSKTCLEEPCSVLEMMIALAIRCEETIMDDPKFGNRIGQWFWGMVVNLGLGSMTDNNFDKDFVDDAITRFINREYEPNGRGGLFTVKNCDTDLRNVEIWYQLCWYLDGIV